MLRFVSLLSLAGCLPGSLPEPGSALALIRGAPLTLALFDEADQESFAWGLEAYVPESLQGEEDGLRHAAALAALPPLQATIDDPEVLAVGLDPACDEALDYCPSVHALGLAEGETTLSWHDPILGPSSMSISVHEPDRIEVLAPDPQSTSWRWSPVWAPRILADPEQAVDFRIRAWDEHVPLKGTDVLHVRHDEGLAVEVRSLADTDGFSVRSDTPGPHTLQLVVAGEPVEQLLLHVVEPEQAVRIQPGPEEQSGEEGEAAFHRRFWVEDGQGNPILGARPTWTIAGRDAGTADTIHYVYDPDGAIEIEARFASLTWSDTLPASEVFAYQASGGALDPWSAAVALGLGLLGWRQRQRRTGG